jgi:hypothetical protein
MKKVLFIILLLCIGIELSAQDLNHYKIPVQDSINHSSIQSPNTISPRYFITNPKQSFANSVANKVSREKLLIVNNPNFKLLADPIFNVYAGQEQISGKTIWGNTRAVHATGFIDLSKKSHLGFARHPGLNPGPNGNPKETSQDYPHLEFSTTYYESQSIFTPYVDSIVRTNRIVPGQMYMGSRGAGIDHAHATGWLKYKPNKVFAFEAGHGKNFFGNGYRSLLLSDGAANYPYFRIDTKIWRIHYVNLWAEFQDINYRDNFEDGWQKKYGAFHYLSFAITDRFEASLFEVINWQGRDSAHHRGFDVNYLNPVILLRPVEWTVGSPDNALLGFNLSYNFGNATYLYGQMIVDEGKFSELANWSDGWWANKLGWQGGFKTWIPIGPRSGVRGPGLKNEESQKSSPRPHVPTSPYLRSIYLQSEFNAVRPYTYTHVTSKQNYGHFNQSLAHPLGANFLEWVNFVRFRWDRFVAEARYSWAKFGSDFNSSNYGHNIYLPYGTYESEYGNFIGQGLENILTYKTITTSYLINPASNLNIFINLTDRHQITALKDKHDLIIQFGLRNSIRNLYNDF